MSDVIISFNSLTKEQRSFAGGKGGALARLYQAHFPVPDGFVIMPTAFVDDELTADAWTQVQGHLASFGKGILCWRIRDGAKRTD